MSGLSGLGGTVVVGATLAAGGSVVTSLAGRPALGRRLLAGAFVAAAGATLLLAWALVTGDFSLTYVADHTRRGASWPWRLAGLWAGMEGSLALWATVLAGHAVLVGRRATRPGAAAQATLAGAVTLFLAPLATVARPFDRLEVPALDGGGLVPVLEHPAMLYHPPLLYLGATALAVPFALTIAALAGGQLDGAWVSAVRRWTLAAWVLLTAAIAAGAHWAYVEVGWGGFWAWDPVENTALLPWLTATALLHLALVPERRGAPADGGPPGGAEDTSARRIAGLALASFLLSVLGAVLTRSGTTVSVHAFAEARAVGRILLVGLVVAVAGSMVLLARHRSARPQPSASPRWTAVAGRTGRRRDGRLRTTSALLVSVAAVVGFGTVVPAVSDIVLDRPLVATARFFVTFTTPLVALLLVVAAAGARLPGSSGRGRPGGRAPSSPFVQGRRGGAALAHLGAALVLAGVVGSTFGTSTSAALRPGESLTAGAYTLRLDRLTDDPVAGRREVGALIAVERDARPVGVVRPHFRVRERGGPGQPEMALRSTLAGDLLVAPRRIDPGRELAVVDAFTKPLAAWVWIGAVLMVAGGTTRWITGFRARKLLHPIISVPGSDGSAGLGSESAVILAGVEHVPRRRRRRLTTTSGSRKRPLVRTG